MDGFLNINKAKGITSFDVIRRLRRITGVKKMGHCGTLDPMATGVIVVAIGEATKLLEYLLKMDKSYRAEITLGAISDTYDADGVLTAPRDGGFELSRSLVGDRDGIERIITENFIGEIEQMPPKYSALKIGGKRACDLMREGKDVQVKSRKIRIDEIKIVEYDWPRLVLDVDCGSGTYIRSLAHDLGQNMGCGAYLSGLTRTGVGEFGLDESHLLSDHVAREDIEDWLLPLTVSVRTLSRIVVTKIENEKLERGQFIDNRWNVHVPVAVFCEEKLVGIAETVSFGRQLKFRKKLNNL